MSKAFIRLTRPNMRKLAPGEKISENGITFERFQNDGVFTVNIMVDGQRIHRVVGRESEGTTRTQAEEFIARVRNDARHDRLSLPKGRKVALSFRDAAAKYLDRLKESDGKDMAAKARRLKLHLIPFFGDTPLSKINTFNIEQYKRHRQHGKYAAQSGTVNRELAVLSHLFSQAEEWGWITHRPGKIKRFPEDPGRIVYLTTEQAARLVECAKADRNETVYPFIVIGLETSMRKSEILSIRRENIDLERRVIYIPQAKAGAREQPITKNLTDFLSGYLAALPPSPWLFPSLAARSGHVRDIKTPFHRVVRAAGLDPKQVVKHTLRHTAITHLVQSGVDLPTVKRISGHKTLIMVERYSHQNGEHIQSAMDKLEERYRLTS
jgi:integrase